MKAMQENFRRFLADGRRAFKIPVFQRNYIWGKDECNKLFEDIVDAASKESGHFIGTIVYVTDEHSLLPWNEYTIIDGQQRITTVMLLLKAIHDLTDDVALKQEIMDDYLTNKRATEVEYRLKLKPIESEKLTWDSIMNGNVSHKDKSNLAINYRYLVESIKRSNFEHQPRKLLDAIEKLWIVYIGLEAEKENPQLIFESINATGKPLTTGDKIRNFLLMDFTQDKQVQFYKDYWLKIERHCNQEGNRDYIPDFVRHYMIMKMRELVDEGKVYDTFKRHVSIGSSKNEELLSELRRYAEYYSWMLYGKDDDRELSRLLMQFLEMKSKVVFSLLLWFFDMHFHKETLRRKALYDIIKTLLSYLYRRLVCGYKTNALNTTFATLPKEIGEADNYPKKLLQILARKKDSQAFPQDDEFESKFVEFAMFQKKLAWYTLSTMEHHLNPNEKIDLSDQQITVEHIMPQKMTSPWRVELGAGWKQIYEKWIHTVGNLTLSGNNSKLSNLPFNDKRSIYLKSNIQLTREYIKGITEWDERAIERRAKKLAGLAVEIWQFPEKYQYEFGTEEIDYGRKYNLLEHNISITGETPESYFFCGKEKPVKNWRLMYEGILRDLCDFDRATYKKILQDNRGNSYHWAVSKDDKHPFKSDPIEIYPGFLTEVNHSPKVLMWLMQLAVQLYSEVHEKLSEDIKFILKPKISDDDY
jgi:uncharacterized protein with ParB-like and HNH nuclease domain